MRAFFLWTVSFPVEPANKVLLKMVTPCKSFSHELEALRPRAARISSWQFAGDAHSERSEPYR